VYEFGPFRLDPKKKTLLRGSELLTLTPKVFEALVLLVENRDRTISKDELMAKLWTDTFVDEANLSQNIFVLRKALGENAQDQRYIVTVRGTGYRFAEPVRELPTVSSTSASAIESAAQREPRMPASGRRLVVGALGLVVLAAGLVGALMYRRSRRPVLTDKDTIVLSDFDNRTGDPIFDGTLKQALTIQLEQTPFLNLLSDQRVSATLKLMNRQVGGHLSRDVALEVCQRTNSKAVVSGAIAALGHEYLVSLEALNCRENGEVFSSQQVRAANKDGVLDALSTASSGLRTELGESLASIRKFDAPLREVTTPSLDALKAFNAGAEIQRHGPDPSAAIPFYNRAIALDPNFALAYAYLAQIYTSIGENKRGMFFLEKAYALRDRVSKREGLLLESFYHSDVTGNTDKEIETYNVWMEEYPRDWLPVDSLATTLRFYFNQYDKAVELDQRAIELDPQQPFSPSGLALSYLALNRVQDARSVLDRELAKGLDNLNIRASLYQVAVMQGDTATADQQARWSDKQPGQDNLGYFLTTAAAQLGRLSDAQAIAGRDVKELATAGFTESAAVELSSLAVVEASFEDLREARRHAASSLDLSRAATGDRYAALALALSGDAAHAQALIQEQERQFPQDVSLHRFIAPCVRAAIAINHHRFGDAIALLEPVRRYDLASGIGFESLYLRGLAFLGANQPSAAAAEFQIIIEHRGVAPLNPIWPLAYLRLARARAFAGDAAGSRSAYGQFFVLWKDADAGIPILQQANAEYRRLR
jgi:DNA-binding winged helix-turn-helix (wHTH) protein/tetratricopeptide (TPR) repeat protein